MAARRRRSKKPSAGSGHSPPAPPPSELTLYLDENLCNSRAIQDTLTRLGVRFERHLDHFASGTPDESWLPLVGSKGWILLTTDKRIRYNLLERKALEIHAVREFVFTSGNMSGEDMAATLEMALGHMRRFCGRTQPPFVASITGAAKFTFDGQKRMGDRHGLAKLQKISHALVVGASGFIPLRARDDVEVRDDVR